MTASYIDLFSGIGGFALGAYWAGWRFDEHYYSEIDPYCCELYGRRFPDAVPLGGINGYREWNLDRGGILTGGFPCQPHSRAGKRRGEEDDRYLWPAMLGVIQMLKPAWAIVENVAGIGDGMVLEHVLSDMGTAGYEVALFEIPAASLGSSQIRYRTWMVANSDGKHGAICLCKGIPPGTVLETGRGRSPVGVGAHSWPPATNDRHGWNQIRAIHPESILPGMAHGVSRRVDRLRGLGNSIVPQIAEMLFRRIGEVA